MDTAVSVDQIVQFFSTLDDPRHTRNRKHRLVDIIAIAICAILSGYSGPTSMHRWAVIRKDWLAEWLELANGIPSRDCIRRVLGVLQPEAFQAVFQTWIVQAITRQPDHKGRFIAIDGKTCRASHDASQDLGTLHIVSAWITDQGLALGQVATEAKSNEIPAIPVLVKQLNIEGATVSLDAMGCQKEIAEAIVQGDGEFVITVKANQPKLLAGIENAFRESGDHLVERLMSHHEQVERGHGQVDLREYTVLDAPQDVDWLADWPQVQAIGRAVRETLDRYGCVQVDTRYFILSETMSATTFGQVVRSHWGIESMHWILDVHFREDQHRTRHRVLANNLSWLRRFAVTLLKRHPSKESLAGKIQRCAMDVGFLKQVLCGK